MAPFSLYSYHPIFFVKLRVYRRTIRIHRRNFLLKETFSRIPGGYFTYPKRITLCYFTGYIHTRICMYVQ
jgi:hypothetical protein